jgi:NPCBM/NEW2 domain
MSHSSPPPGKPILEPPAASSEGPGRKTRKASHAASSEGQGGMIEKAGLVVGIVTGVAGTLSGVGFALLPTATWTDRALVVVASLALSVAGFSGIGAWQSGRKFAFAATSAGLALICLAGLSVAAQARLAPAPRTAPPSAVSSDQLLSATSDGSHNFQVGPQTVRGVQYPQTAFSPWQDNYCSSSQWPTSITFDLDSKYRNFRVTVGVSDDSPAGDKMRFMILADGLLTGANPTLSPGQTQVIDVAVTGIHRISLENECMGSALDNGTTVTAVWINPIASP